MGCLLSTRKDSGENRRRPGSIGEVSVYVPGLRIPKPVDFAQSLGNYLSKNIVERLSALRTRIVVMASQEGPTITRTKRRSATQHGGSTLADLLHALEDYLPVLLGLVKDGSNLQYRVKFVWVNQEDDAEETAMSNAWYEVLSVLHLMATLLLSQANLLLLPRSSSDGNQPKVTEVDYLADIFLCRLIYCNSAICCSCIVAHPNLRSSYYEILTIWSSLTESRRNSVDIFLKAAGYLDCAVRHVLPQLPLELRRNLPVDLAEGVLRALCLQALGQGVDIQLGVAIDSAKATIAVKRRLACEMVKYWQQAQDNIMNLPLANGWGEKHHLFVKWKYVEAKAAAYYYHGLILDEGNTEKAHGMAVAALQVADEYFKESKKLCEVFNASPPLSRNPPLWGTMKYLSEKIPKDTSSKVRINRDLYSHERIMETAPTLPDFALALKPDEYQLPSVDPSWRTENIKEVQSGLNS
ncbi:hypothetical protein Lal_00045500 [Lupinus albus]|nr:hypothetical protein Lal_00045500 [Lupinus albus]